MRKWMGVVALVWIGCGAAQAPASEAPPQGSNGAWYCWVGDTYISDCQRTLEDCQASADSAREMLTADIACNPQPSAFCVTHRITTSGSEDTVCLASAQSCEGMSDDIMSGGVAEESSPCTETR